MPVLDLRKQTGDAADGIVKIIEAKAKADQAQTELQKSLALDQIKRQRDRQDKQLEQQDQQANWTKMMDPSSQDPSIPNNTQGMANSGTPAQAGATPDSLSAMPQGGYTPQQPPPMSLSPKFSVPQAPAMPTGAPIGQQDMAQGGATPQPMAQPSQQPSKQLAELGFTPVGVGQLAMARGGKPEAKDFAYIQALNKAKQGTASPSEIELIKDFNGFKDIGKDIAGGESLNDDQRLQGMALARKVGGVRGMSTVAPFIFKKLASGMNIDEVEDSIRMSSQSSKLSGDMRNAAQSILVTSSESVSQKALDTLDDVLSSGNEENAKNYLKRMARKEAGVEEARNIGGKERTVELVGEIQGDLEALERLGVDTNIFSGTAEQISKAVGTVREPELRKIATKIALAIQSYRRSMSGAAFSIPESQEYKDVFPGIGRTANFNSANISAIKEVFSGDLDNFYSLSMGANEYNNIFKGGQGGDSQPDTSGVGQVLTATNPTTKQKITSTDGGQTWQ